MPRITTRTTTTLAASLAAACGLALSMGCESNQRRADTHPVADAPVNNAWTVHRDSERPGRVTLAVPGPEGDDGLIVRRYQPDEVRAGETLRYTMEVENVGDTAVHNVVLREWRQGDFEIQRAGMTGGQNTQRSSENTGGDPGDSWTINSLYPGERRTIEVVGVAPQSGQVATCMTVTYDPTLCIVTNVVKPEITLARTIASQTAYTCDPVDVTYTIRNTGDAATRPATLTEELPDGLTTANNQQTVKLDIPAIPPGESAKRTVKVTASSTGEYTTHATITSGNIEARSTESKITFVKPELGLDIDAPSREYVGRDIPVRINLTNTSDTPALRTTLKLQGASDLAQTSLSTSDATLEGNTITVGRLEPGETKDMTLTFRAQEARTRSITVAANAYCADTVSDKVSIDLTGVQAIRLETIDLVDPVVVGEQTTYEVKVKNQGTAEGVNVGITALLPQELSFVSAQGDTNVTARGNELTFQPLGTLPPGEVATWRITARADSPAKTRLQLELTSDATTRPITEQEPTTIIDKPAAAGG